MEISITDFIELMTKFSKIGRHKFSIKVPTAFFYTNKGHVESKLRA